MISKVLRKNRADRYQLASDLAGDLKSAQGKIESRSDAQSSA